VVVMATPDAAVVAPRPDAAQVASTVDAGVVDEKAKEAKALYEKGHAALEDGDPTAALALLDQSLALKKSAKTYMEKARALQRLQKIDEAVAAAQDAINARGGSAAVEQKGMILWAAQRYPEARVVFEQYLEQYPTGNKASTIRALLEENK
jgi:tetratricopeptide (TPR) repeat protein